MQGLYKNLSAARQQCNCADNSFYGGANATCSAAEKVVSFSSLESNRGPELTLMNESILISDRRHPNPFHLSPSVRPKCLRVGMPPLHLIVPSF